MHTPLGMNEVEEKFRTADTLSANGEESDDRASGSYCRWKRRRHSSPSLRRSLEEHSKVSPSYHGQTSAQRSYASSSHVQ